GSLIADLEKTLDVLGPDGLVSAYTGTGRPDQFTIRRKLRAAATRGESWIHTGSLYWGPAIIAPVYTIEAMLDWSETYVGVNEPSWSNDYHAVRAFYKLEMGWRCWYTVPSLVYHRGLPSLVGHDTDPVR